MGTFGYKAFEPLLQPARVVSATDTTNGQMGNSCDLQGP
jgi:hypothetical protein